MAEFDKAWLDAYCARTGVKNPLTGKNVPAQTEEKKPAKYRNKKVEIDGWKFDSEHESNVYLMFKSDTESGKYRAFFCQVPFMLPGGIKYVCDFLTFNNDGTFTVWDAKSEATAKDKVYRMKKKLMREKYGIEIREILNRV